MKWLRRNGLVFLHLVFYWIIAGVLFYFLWQQRTTENPVVVIYYQNQPVYRGRLEEDRVFTISKIGEDVVFEIRDGKVRIRENHCPRRICMRMGWIHRIHDQIICVPRRILVVIEKGKKNSNGPVRVLTG